MGREAWDPLSGRQVWCAGGRAAHARAGARAGAWAGAWAGACAGARAGTCAGTLCASWGEGGGRDRGCEERTLAMLMLQQHVAPLRRMSLAPALKGPHVPVGVAATQGMRTRVLQRRTGTGKGRGFKSLAAYTRAEK